MTTLPKHLEKMRQFWINCFLIDENENNVEANVYVKPPKHWRKIPSKMDFHVIEKAAIDLLLKDMESMAKALEKICKRNDIPEALLDYYGDCAMALKIWREKYGE